MHASDTWKKWNFSVIEKDATLARTDKLFSKKQGTLIQQRSLSKTGEWNQINPMVIGNGNSYNIQSMHQRLKKRTYMYI